MAELHPRLLGTRNIDDLRETSRRRLPKGLFEFVDREADDEITMARNRAAFGKRSLLPLVLVDISAPRIHTLIGHPAGRTATGRLHSR